MNRYIFVSDDDDVLFVRPKCFGVVVSSDVVNATRKLADYSGYRYCWRLLDCRSLVGDFAENVWLYDEY